MKKLFSLLLILFALVTLTGCRSSTTGTVEEFDTAGNLLKRTSNVSEESMAKSILESTKNKTVIYWSSGWIAEVIAEFTGSSESAMPNVRIRGGKVDTGVATILKDQDNLDKVPAIIKATRSDLAVTTSGISENNSTVSGESVTGTSSKTTESSTGTSTSTGQ